MNRYRNLQIDSGALAHHLHHLPRTLSLTSPVWHHEDFRENCAIDSSTYFSLRKGKIQGFYIRIDFLQEKEMGKQTQANG